MKRTNVTIVLITFLSICINADAIALGKIKFNNEISDTTKITEILKKSLTTKTQIGEREISIAETFVGAPYESGTLEGDDELLRVNLDRFDCTTFVETVLALAMTAEERRSSWRDFVYHLEQIRYRNGKLGNYASRLHYISDWITDNSHRGIVKDVTREIGNAGSMVKTLDYMSRNRDKYPALSDSAAFEGIKLAEMGYRNHMIPYIKPTNVKAAQFKDGDIVIMVSKIPGLDASHVGFIKMVNGEPHLLHASSATGNVTLDSRSLSDYLKRNRSVVGVRVVRLSE